MAPGRILVTGASGFVGQHLVRILSKTFPSAELHELRTDITDRAAVAARVQEIQPDSCVHLAGIAAIAAARQDTDQAWRINLLGTLALAQAVLAFAPSCVFVLASSADAYGASFRSGDKLTETSLLAPLNTYAATKAAADLAIGALAADGLRAIRVRPFNHTGPGQSADFVVPAFARQVARIAAGQQAPVLRVGTLDTLRDFLDVRDVCTAYAACIARADDLAPGTILNVASGVPRRTGDILDGLLAVSGVTASIETDSTRLRAADIPTATGDASLARRVLDWQPRIAWEQTLRDVFDDWRLRVQGEAHAVPNSRT